MPKPIIALVAAIFLGIVGQASAAPKTPKVKVALPDCRAVGETRIRVPVWSGSVKKDKITPALPATKNGLVVYIVLYGEGDDVDCASDGSEKRITLTGK